MTTTTKRPDGELNHEAIELVRKAAFALRPAEQYRLAAFVAENVGYVLGREPDHPESPHTPANESPAPQAWRNINTAPRDGTEFLAWQDAERGPFKCWWHTEWPRAEAYWMDPQDSEPEPKFWQPMLPVPLER